jgi:hypothetical protein
MNLANLVIVPGKTITRDEFLTHPAYAIALDGYVPAEPFLHIDATGAPRRNFNHHEVVDRSCTNATCEQVRKAILLGLYDLFTRDGRKHALLYVNDCDQDVCLSTWLLLNPDRAAEPLVRQLSQIEDLMDGSSGTFPMPHDRALLSQVRWVFEPYDRSRGRLQLTIADMRSIIEDVHHRIDRFVVGKASELPISGTYQLCNGGGADRFWYVETSGADARLQMVADGCKAAIEQIGEARIDGITRYKYTLWRRSEYVAWFPIPELLAALNLREAARATVLGTTAGLWGGSTTVGGSPRGIGSVLLPQEVDKAVHSIANAKRTP